MEKEPVSLEYTNLEMSLFYISIFFFFYISEQQFLFLPFFSHSLLSLPKGGSNCRLATGRSRLPSSQLQAPQRTPPLRNCQVSLQPASHDERARKHQLPAGFVAPWHLTMVLQDLGRRINAAVSDLTRAPNLDEKASLQRLFQSIWRRHSAAVAEGRGRYRHQHC
jgi:hypothetical protein